jgi:hypothetical protein
MQDLDDRIADRIKERQGPTAPPLIPGSRTTEFWIAVAALWPTVLFTILPPIVWLHQRLGDGDGAMARPLRQSALAALYLSICVWLRMVRALNWANASLLLILFVLTDVLLVSRSSG